MASPRPPGHHPAERLEPERLALRRYHHVLGASFHLPAGYLEPGVVEVRSSPAIAVVLIGRLPGGPDPLAERVAEQWTAAGYAVQVTEDISRWKASKLLWNVNNAVEVLAGDASSVAALRDALAAEAHMVLTAAGVEIAERTADADGLVVQARPAGRPAACRPGRASPARTLAATKSTTSTATSCSWHGSTVCRSSPQPRHSAHPRPLI